MNLNKLEWFSVKVAVDNEYSEITSSVIKNIAFSLVSKRSKHSLWFKINNLKSLLNGYTHHNASYEVLIPNLDKHAISVLEDLDYIVTKKHISRQERRDEYTKIKRP